MDREEYRHRGILIVRRSQRWRWEMRFEGQQIRRSFADVDAAIDELDHHLNLRQQKRSIENATGGYVLTIGYLIDDWFRWKKAEIAPATVQQYGIHIRVHIKPSIGEMDANKIRPVDLDTFYRSLRWKPAKESHNILRQAFDWGLKNGVLVREANPASIARPSKRTSTDSDGTYDSNDRITPIDEKDIPTQKEVEKLILDAEARNDRAWWLYLKLATVTGARPGEVSALRRSDFDFSNCSLSIQWAADRIGGRIKRPKTPSGVRTLYLPKAFLEEIAAALPTDPNAFLFESNTYHGGNGSPLPCWNSRSVKRRLDRALERTGIRHITPHAFRHYVATRLLANGESPTQVARFLGHADDSLVRKLYGNHFIDEELRRVGAAAVRNA